MAELLICNGRVPAEFSPAAARMRAGFADVALLIKEERIAALAPADTLHAHATLDAQGCFVLPGFIDLHVHGAVGMDTMDASAAGLHSMAAFFARHGVTAFLPTTMTAASAPTLAAVRAVAAAMTSQTEEPPHGARILGVHLEGPYISPRFPGAQPAGHIRPPDRHEFLELVAAGPVRMITLAPEVPGATALVQIAQEQKIITVLGHTNATYEECITAIHHGVSQATHTYNAMSGLHHRHPGALGAVLSHDQLYAQLIADTIHVHPAAMKILARCKGIERTLLITDAMRATGLGPGHYDLGGQSVTVQGDECRLADGTLAGSILTMERALGHFMVATGLALAAAWPATSRSPAQALDLAHDHGALTPGYRADLVLLDAQLQVMATLVGGAVVYLREPERLRMDDRQG
jgi:N-acetylglucosamine-6-phosphate deacetylase